MFEKILIANRGEIAVRVIRTAKALGYTTVAVYSEADANAPHVMAADEAVCIGPAAVGESYLVADNIMKAIKLTGAQAVHPGYGFLSENSEFANVCEKNNIIFIGPPASAIELMGSKRLSKIAMIKAGVPCIAGYEGEEQAVDALVKQAKKIGFPIMVKASAGGGGRGMRLVFKESELEEQIKTARSEAENAFGSGELILEKAVIQPRHIEIQVFADQHGNAVYLGERDCSIQRRHQKVVEEAPSPFVDSELRKQMGEAAIQAALACNYVGAGTVEFLVDADKNFYFLEMNTRLQVEHPVTELITGTDLVEWQLNVAAGSVLPKSQNEITLKGHAIEVRLYAEDPAQQFMPQTGHIERWLPVENAGVRIDSGIRSGQEVSPFYDPMLAKIIAYGSDREEARRKLVRAVAESTLFGVNINSEFLCAVLQHPVFINGEATTAFIADDFGEHPTLSPQKPPFKAVSLACLLSHLQQSNRLNLTAASFSGSLSGWSNVEQSPWPYQLNSGDYNWELSLKQDATKFVIAGEEESTEELIIELVNIDSKCITFIHEGVRQHIEYLMTSGMIYMRIGSAYYAFTDLTHAASSVEDAAGSGHIKASMDGAIIDVLVEAGAEVSKGQTLVILEAMKMEHPLKSDVDGVVSNIHIAQGDQVKLRQLLVEVTPNE